MTIQKKSAMLWMRRDPDKFNTFLLPVKALSRIFRAKFRDALRHTPAFAGVPSTVW